jgi:hypothetical protein
MMRPWGLVLGLVAVLAGCGSPARLAPDSTGASATEAPAPEAIGPTEPLMEPVIVEEQGATSLGRAAARPDDCAPGDDGIGGTGCGSHRDQSRRRSLIEVFDRVCASTFFTMTAQ